MRSPRPSPRGRGGQVRAPIFSQDRLGWDVFIRKAPPLVRNPSQRGVCRGGFKPALIDCKRTSYPKISIAIQCLRPAFSQKKGLAVGIEGNIYCGGSGGLWVLDERGRHLGIVAHGQTATTNLAFGGNDWKTLFFTSRNTLGSVQAKIAGVPVPAGGK